MSALTAFKNLVHQRCGLHLEGLAEARLDRAVASLQATTRLTDTTQLLTHLTSDPALFDHFVSQLTVNETYFYREPDALNWLVNTYLPERLAAGAAALSIFSAGCSSGEEPYSVAMLLAERFGEHAKALFTIAGGDVDQQILAKARQGLYSGMAFRALPPTLKERYFSPDGQYFKVNESLRQWVSFRTLNLLDTDESSVGGPFDVILFRNVSIYFDEQTRRRIQQTLRQLLAPNGILLCGITETLGNDLGVFELVHAQEIFYFQPREQATERADDQPPPPLAALATGSDAESDIKNDIKNDKHVASFTARTGVPPATLAEKQSEKQVEEQPEEQLEEQPERATAEGFSQQLLNAHQLLNQNAFADAAALLHSLLEQRPWSIDALVLAGLVARWQQQPQLAYDYFKRAIYTAPECWPAHFYLAELYRQGELADEPAQRQRGYAAVVRLLAAAPTASGGLDTIEPPLPPGDARFLAERYLAAVNTMPVSPSTTQGVG
ncbi:MAG: methylase of chemotaxis methyl-accepting protein [Halomonas sp. 54_146]|nr:MULTISPECIES: protein-glutamate O-methyltransferase CheR [unclassified Halomonas]KUJ88626.1 MAG: methylase of chemotaxis methyl-accepting protein [Halomonas sp. 54_146]HAA44746.1 methylase [Halomonas sp.]